MREDDSEVSLLDRDYARVIFRVGRLLLIVVLIEECGTGCNDGA